MNYPKKELLRMYELLVQGRKYEEKVLSLIKQGKVQGFFHLAIGQEAVGVGMVAALRPNDYFMPTHRSHPGLAAKMDLKKLTAELLGKRSGYCQGKAFTFHISSKEEKILPVTGNGMLGVGVPTSVGFAWALKMDKKDSVVVCVGGDGLQAEGNVHEGMNMAGIMKVPIVFLIENNSWAISNPISEHSTTRKLSDRAAGYGMPAITCDGDDVIAVREAVEQAISLAAKNQPVVVEAFTHRWRGHFEGDPQVYRDKKELDEIKQYCPVQRFGELLTKQDIATVAELAGIDDAVQRRVDEAFEFALNAPYPTAEETLDLDLVYASNLGGELLW